jgi:hypothetical protein
MSSYKVFKHPEKGFKAVKSGFAWLAPFNPIWPLFRGLWALFITYIIFILVLASIDALIYGLDDLPLLVSKEMSGLQQIYRRKVTSLIAQLRLITKMML